MVFFKQAMNLCCGENEMMNTLVGKIFKKKDSEEEQIPDTKQPKKTQAQNPNAGNKLRIKTHAYSMAEMHYETTLWSKLPAKAKKAAEGLGYDQEKWDNSHHLHIEDKHWHDLSEDEKKHVETLGWTEEAWEHQYEHVDWKDLPAHVKKAAESVGFDEEKWDHDHWPHELEHTHWADLSDKDRDAMAVLGYTKHEWD